MRAALLRHGHQSVSRDRAPRSAQARIFVQKGAQAAATRNHRRILALLALALVPILARPAQAQEPGHQSPVFLWGVQQGAGRDAAVEAAVWQRLEQMGETVLPAPQLASSAPCSGPACGLALRNALEIPTGRVVGSHIDTLPTGERRVRLWWVDLATSKVVSRNWTCRSCDLLQMLPREAAQLAFAAPSLPADPVDGCLPPVPAAPGPASSGPADPLRTAIEQGVLISLRATGGARAPAAKLTKKLQEALLQMGFRAIVRSPETSSSASQTPSPPPALLDIELAGDANTRRGAVESIALTLQAQGHERRLRFYCPLNGCQNQLDRSLRINLAVVLDSGELPLVAAAVAPSNCASPLPLGRLVAMLPDGGPFPASGTSTAASDSNTGRPQPIAGTVNPPQKAECPKTDNGRMLKIAGGILLGAGLLGFIPSGYYFAVDGTRASDNGCQDQGFDSPCQWDSRKVAIGGIVASGAAVLLGGSLLIYSYRRSQPSKGNSSCVATAN